MSTKRSLRRFLGAGGSRWVPTGIWALMALACVLSIFVTRQSQTVADDSEYLLMNQSLLEHGSVDVREGDSAALVASLPGRWRGSVRKLVRPPRPRGYFESKDGSQYSYHFPLYSLAALPFKALLHGLGLDESRAFQYTNILWFVLALFALRSAAAGWVLWLAFLTPLLWMLAATYAESFVFSLGLLATASYLTGRYRTSILWYSLAAMQFQPLLLAAAAVSLRAFGDPERRASSARAKAWYAASVIALLALGLVPMLWHFVLFGTPNLIAEIGMASWSYVTADRFKSFFFDLNLGMIAYVPGHLALLALAVALRLVDFARGRIVPMLQVCLLAVGILSTTSISNWNSGMSGPSRYVVSFLPAIVLVIASALRGRAMPWLKWSIIAALALQVLAVGTRGVFQYRGAAFNEHNQVAQLVLSRWPQLYSPEVHVFCRRTLGDCSMRRGIPARSLYPIIFRTKEGVPKKALCIGRNPKPLLRSLEQPDVVLSNRIRRAFRARQRRGRPFYINL